jgi:hypothetical protein
MAVTAQDGPIKLGQPKPAVPVVGPVPIPNIQIIGVFIAQAKGKYLLNKSSNVNHVAEPE